MNTGNSRRTLGLENEGCTTERIQLQHFLRNRRKAVQAFAKIDRPRCNVNPRRNRAEDHRRLFCSPPAASITAKIVSRDAFGGMRSLAPLSLTSIIGGEDNGPSEADCTDGYCMTTIVPQGEV